MRDNVSNAWANRFNRIAAANGWGLFSDADSIRGAGRSRYMKWRKGGQEIVLRISDHAPDPHNPPVEFSLSPGCGRFKEVLNRFTERVSRER